MSVFLVNPIEPLDFDAVRPGDVVGIGIHTSNAFRGYTLGRLARERGAHVVFGGWGEVLEDCSSPVCP